MSERPSTRHKIISVLTRMTFSASPERAWSQLRLYEQIDQRPPLHLRLLLPVPIRSEGRQSEVGEQATCMYETGYLRKRVTQVEPGRRYEFEIVDQGVEVGGGMELTGGAYGFREIPDGRTEVTLATSYVSPRRPRWLWRPIEAAVCHLFHFHILGSMRRSLRGR